MAMFAFLATFLMLKPISAAEILNAREDVFERRLRSAELSIEALQELARPFTGKAVIGLPMGQGEAAVTPEGAVLAPLGGRRLWLQFESRGTPERRMPDPRVPLVAHRTRVRDVEFEQRAYVAPDGSTGGVLVVEARWRNQGSSDRTVRPILKLAALERLANFWQDPEQIPMASPDAMLHAGNRLELGENYCAFLSPAPAKLSRYKGEKAWQTNRLTWPEVALGPREKLFVTLRFPLGPGVSKEPKTSFRQFQQIWSDAVTSECSAHLPDPMLEALRQKLITQLLVTAEGDFMPYGAFPSAYDNDFYGPEEGWCIQALAEWGHADLAKRFFRATFLTESYGDKTNRHHQYRNGLLAKYAHDLTLVLNDASFDEEVRPHVRRSAEWTLGKLAADPMGLMPPYNYGGDITKPARALWPNACAWRGLRDAGLLLRDSKLLDAAAKYRGRIRRTFSEADGHRDGFYPLSLEETESTQPSPEYYQLFAPMILEMGLFGAKDPEFAEMVRYMERTGRLQAGIPRFVVGKTVGIDAEYAYGLQLMRLRAGMVREFLLGVWGQIGLSMDPVYGTSPEVTPLLLDSAAQRAQRGEQEEHWGRSTEPCSAGVGVTLLYLRRMLAFEENDGDDRPTGVLRLFPAVPESWWQAKTPWGVEGLPTAYGKLSMQVRKAKERWTLTAQLEGKGSVAFRAFRVMFPKGARDVKVGSETQVAAAEEMTVTVPDRVLTLSWRRE